MSKFIVKKAVREDIWAKIALMAPSGGGKTYSALRLATGMARKIKELTGKDVKIGMLNTEGKRGYYYANEFDYEIIDLESPFEPELFIDALEFAVEEQKWDIVIMDSSSAEWEGKGGCLELHSKAGGRYQDWSKITPRHEKFINAIASSKVHLICTMRGKDQYVMTQEGQNNKTKVEKVGVGAKQRDGFEYEFTCTFMIDQKTNTSEAMKDNTHIFENEGNVKLTEEHGEKIIVWANEGVVHSENKDTKKAEIKKELQNEKVEEDKKQEVTKKTLKELKEEILALCKDLSVKGKRDIVVTTVKQLNNENANPNDIDNQDIAEQVLKALKEI